MKVFNEIGAYVLLMFQAFKRPDKGRVFRRQLMMDFEALGTNSLGIIIILSLFFGAIIAIQMAYNIDNPMIPLKTIGFSTRQMMIVEFAPTIMSLILAGKVGSSIASEIGSMRVTEQIDALEVMGINPANYLILPKITASMIYNPILTIFSIVVGIFGGWLAMIITGLSSSVAFIEGVRSWYDPFTVTYAIIKTIVFAFIIASVSGYKGYTVKGGSVEVGKASTQAVVYSSILIIVFDLILTQMLLT
ncbi:MAG: ABC transporter permease [Bacteroidetes bacterium]|nr:MAG: ABC transporter permease [Bacteroidota bacterium]RLD73940.1 MAG: ABC transporter permease [Bacteroidota bacterium]RLD85988.1 MAG: ABC transporter permease [Bacteroidota bacterium]HHL57665.1 ABC transporter permease [Bacteroidota bacterium]